jgi:uncharacterized protein (TIGR04255 family)
MDSGETPGLADYACERVPNAQLPLVTAQTRFPPVTRLGDRIQEIRDELRRDYPIFTEEKALALIIKDGKASTEESGRILRLTSIDMQWAAVLSDDYIALETRKYDGIRDFGDRVDALWRVINRILDPQYQVRIGFRFINEFRHPDGDEYSTWRRLMNRDLLGFDANGVLGGAVKQTISETILDREDGQLIMRRGFLRGTTVVPVANAAAPTGGFYLLDLDYVDSTPGPFEAAPSARLRQYNGFLHSIFRWVIGDGEYYRYLMGQE